MPHERTDEQRAEDALSYLDANDRDNWVKMAFAVKSEFGEDGFHIWDQWSQSADSYRSSDAQSIWKSAKAGGKVTIATLFFQAKERGWKDDSVRKQVSAEEKAQRAAARSKRDADEAAAQAVLREAAAVRANAIWSAASDCDEHPYLERKQVKSHGLRVGAWEVTDPDTGKVRVVTKQALLVPIRDAAKRIHSLQAIYPGKIGGRDKDYLKDGAKSGLFYSFGKPVTMDVAGVQRQVILIGEGYATMATAYELTGHAAIATFDAGNVPVVARVLREKFPEACLVMLADNDQWTKGNPGVTKAREAANAVGGVVAIPQFDAALGVADDDGKVKGPTDFNDLHALEGADAVRDTIAEAINPPEVILPDDDAVIQPWEYAPDDVPLGEATPPSAPTPPGRNGHFTILGYNRETYYIFQHGKRQITERSKGDFSEVGLIELADINWWEANFPGARSGIDTKAAAQFIIRTAEQRGIFDTEKIRGRGAWLDDGRVVYHHGSHLSVDGQPMDVTQISSQYVYEMAKSMQLPAEVMMTDEEGKKLVDITKMFRWTVDGSALLFAGWIALAPICGAIPWRPHLWMTGGAGSGKSSLAKFAHSLLKGTDVFAQGNSSEAGIRQRLRADARPVIMDESESNEEGDARRVQSILGLIRQASTESDAETLKGTTDGSGMTYHIRSMFCLASIQVALKHKADIDRLTVLTLRSGKESDQSGGNGWARMRDTMYEFCGREDTPMRGRLLRRSIELLPTTLKNIEVFSAVGADVFGSQRDGDQYGALLAGAWSLISTAVATREQAREIFDSHNWQELRADADSDESHRALSALMEAHVRVKSGTELTVYELVKAASGSPTGVTDINDVTADALLQRHGMKVKDGYLVLSNNSNELKRLMQGTTFEADLRGVLLRVDGADKNTNKPERFNGMQNKCIRIPLAPIVGTAPQEPAF